MNRRQKADQLTELVAKALLTYEKSLGGVEVPMTAEELNNPCKQRLRVQLSE